MMPLVLMTLMLAQALLGLMLPDQYRDADWIQAAWYGNDWVTLAAAVPLLGYGRFRASRGSLRGVLLVLGVAGYAVYNYAFYLFGAALNVFFPLYVLSFLFAGATLCLMLSRLDVREVARCFDDQFPARVLGAYLLVVAVGLTVVWLGLWGRYVFAGQPTPIEPEAFKVVAALDLSLMVPAFAVGGVLLGSRRAWGYAIALIAAVQGALYLSVLSVNAAIAINRGLTAAPGELPVWGPLALFTTIAAVILVRNASGNLCLD
jgi:hypothetical protein